MDNFFVPVFCHVCGSSFVNRSNFWRHLRSHTRDPYAFCCSYINCVRLFPQRSQRDLHEKKCHINDTSRKFSAGSEFFLSELDDACTKWLSQCIKRYTRKRKCDTTGKADAICQRKLPPKSITIKKFGGLNLRARKHLLKKYPKQKSNADVYFTDIDGIFSSVLIR